jgi:hypothetical protein
MRRLSDKVREAYRRAEDVRQRCNANINKGKQGLMTMNGAVMFTEIPTRRYSGLGLTKLLQ